MCLWTAHFGSTTQQRRTVHCYSLNGKTFIVIIYAPNVRQAAGFDIYVPVTDSNDIVDTFEKLNNYLKR